MSFDRLLPPQRRGPRLLALSVLLLILFYMAWPVNFYLAENLKRSYYMAFVPVLTAGALYFGGLKQGREYLLVFLYWIWFLLTRILCGDPALKLEYVSWVDLSLMLPCLLTGLVLEKDERRSLLNWLGGLMGAFYFVLGLLALYASVRRTTLINPITGGYLGVDLEDSFRRINILDTNVDVTACWYMMIILVLVHQFFTCRSRLWRIPIALALLVDYAVITITYTRSVQLSLALVLAILICLPVRHALRGKSKALVVLCMLAVFVLSAGGLFLGHRAVAAGLGAISQQVSLEQTPEPAALPEAPAAPVSEAEAAPESPAETEDSFADPRAWNGNLNGFSSGRIAIYKSAFYVMGKNPAVLLRGSLERDYMTIANEVLPRKTVHYQNYLLEVLMLTGIPGFLLVLAFTLLIVIKGLRLFFASEDRVPLGDKLLGLPVAAMMLYGMFERCIFTYMDVRFLYFFLFCGLMLAAYREHFETDKL